MEWGTDSVDYRRRIGRILGGLNSENQWDLEHAFIQV